MGTGKKKKDEGNGDNVDGYIIVCKYFFFQSRDDLGISKFSSLLSFSYLSMIVHRLVCHVGANICDCLAYRELCENVNTS